jgi:hypothetical protein
MADIEKPDGGFLRRGRSGRSRAHLEDSPPPPAPPGVRLLPVHALYGVANESGTDALDELRLKLDLAIRCPDCVCVSARDADRCAGCDLDAGVIRHWDGQCWPGAVEHDAADLPGRRGEQGRAYSWHEPPADLPVRRPGRAQAYLREEPPAELWVAQHGLFDAARDCCYVIERTLGRLCVAVGLATECPRCRVLLDESPDRCWRCRFSADDIRSWEGPPLPRGTWERAFRGYVAEKKAGTSTRASD